MKKLLSILLITVLLLSIAGCTAAEEKEIVLPPTRYGHSTGLVDYATYDAADFYANAEVVARVKVGSWLWEDRDANGGGYTYFEAQALECYKGSLPENFTLRQSATSGGTLEGPIFTYGNEKILFMSKAVPGRSPYKDTYGCGTFSAMDVSCDNGGDPYIIVRHSHVAESVTRTTPIAEIPVSEVRMNAGESDPLLGEDYFQSAAVFSEEDIKLFFAGLEQEQTVSLPERGTGVLPPTRFTRRGGAPGAFYWEEEDTFEAAYAQADVVARVKVGNWLGEDAQLQVTYYEATVVDTFKGDIPESFVLKQAGYTQEGAVLLFTYGNEVLLFLKSDEDPNYENTFTDPKPLAVIDVSYDDHGNAYYLARHDDFAATIPCQALDDYGRMYDIYNNLLEQDRMIDVLRSGMQSAPYTFPESDLNAWLEAQINE